MNVAIAGFGVEGRTNYQYWKGAGHNVVIADERSQVNDLPYGAESILGRDAFARLSEFDLIVRSPGINPRKLPYGEKVWSATNEFFERCPTPYIIGVTGTKGKGTACSLITSILRAAGRTVHLVGNIGTPALRELPNIGKDDIVVFELSSFQLWDCKKSPHVAVVLMIEPDHLDVHDGIEDYIGAKANITLHQSPDDVLVFNQTNDVAVNIAESSAARVVPYPFAIPQFTSHLRLPGAHNVENASAAIAAVREYVTDEAVIAEGLRAFEGLPHRLKHVADINGVGYYDDSIATTPGSVIAAIKSFDAPKVMIIGGSDKGADYTELFETIQSSSSIRAVVTMGANGATSAAALRMSTSNASRIIDMSGASFDEVIQIAADTAQPGDVVILSPAAASFDMFKSYADRGEQFIANVSALETQ